MVVAQNQEYCYMGMDIKELCNQVSIILILKNCMFSTAGLSHWVSGLLIPDILKEGTTSIFNCWVLDSSKTPQHLMIKTLSSKSFIYQQMHFISILENIIIYIKTYIKIGPTCFSLWPSSGILRMSLAKVTFIKWVKVRHYGLCGCVAACCHT